MRCDGSRTAVVKLKQWNTIPLPADLAGHALILEPGLLEIFCKFIARNGGMGPTKFKKKNSLLTDLHEVFSFQRFVWNWKISYQSYFMNFIYIMLYLLMCKRIRVKLEVRTLVVLVLGPPTRHRDKSTAIICAHVQSWTLHWKLAFTVRTTSNSNQPTITDERTSLH